MKMIENCAALTIAGSDSGGGAGIQADWKAFAAMGAYGCSAITAITAQNSTGVASMHPLPLGIVRAQIDAVFSDFSISAVKTGMLPTVEIVSLVASLLKQRPEIPLVVDPVLRATTGADLQEGGVMAAMKDELFPLATLITPNADEASRLSGLPTDTADAIRAAARALLLTQCRWVLITGGDLPGKGAIDYLASADDSLEFSAPKVDTPHTHGSGCTLASSAAVQIALGEEVPNAVRNAKWFITEAINNPLRVGKGRGSVHALHQLLPWKPPK